MILAHNGWLWLQVAAIAFLGSLAVTGFMRFAGLGDSADLRSSHSGVVPTSGGIGLIAGLGLSLCSTALIFPDLELTDAFAPVLALIFGMAVLGLTDDLLTLGPKLKFGVMIVICAAAVRTIGAPQTLPGFNGAIMLPYWLGFAGAVLWLFVVTNIVNFMDGANGMIGLCMAVVFFALFGAGLIAGSLAVMLLSVVFLMTILGFLPYNVRHKAQIFGGDVGALTLGFSFAVCILFLTAGTPERSLHLVGPILILPLLVDSLLTIVQRIRNKENILRAHRQHLYQRLIQTGRGHLTVSSYYAVLTLICANVVIIGLMRGWLDDPRLFLMLTGGLTLIWVSVGKALRDPRHDKSG